MVCMMAPSENVRSGHGHPAVEPWTQGTAAAAAAAMYFVLLCTLGSVPLLLLLSNTTLLAMVE